ncbi:hypothetical protein QTP86_000647 [Hemibagrus guttatus]|nr:hypothetical protein QTP86_000647 [Hemibagrus guttatus]
MALLLVLASLRQVGDLQALSVTPICLEFAPGMSKAILQRRAGCVPKVRRMAGRPVILQAFCLLPHESAEQERLHLLCPVRALRTYVHRFGSWHKSPSLFICFAAGTRRNTFLGVICDSTMMWACLSPAWVASILSAVNSVQLDQSLSVAEAQRVLGLMAAAANVIPLGLLHMRPFQFWLRGAGFHPRRHPLDAIRVMRRRLYTLLTWTRPQFLAAGPTLRACHHHGTLLTDASLSVWVRSWTAAPPRASMCWCAQTAPQWLLISTIREVSFLQTMPPLLGPLGGPGHVAGSSL